MFTYRLCISSNKYYKMYPVFAFLILINTQETPHVMINKYNSFFIISNKNTDTQRESK